MATAADSARSRDTAETQAEALYKAAVAYVALSAAAGEDTDEAAIDPSSALMRAAQTLATLLILSVPSRYGTELPEDMPGASVQDRAAVLAPQIAETAATHAREHLNTISERVRRSNPAATDDEVIAVFKADTPWQRAVARTTATRMAAETALDMVPNVDKLAGEAHRAMWISRGDHKVRPSHRRLHGKLRAPGKSFKMFPGGGKLAFPGDPRAPLDETINCRCSIILVPEATSWKALDTFRVSDEDFDLTASAAPFSQAELDLTEELTRRG